MTTFIGTSGWQYRHWRDRYYPHELRQDRWLERYVDDFATVELNASFYNLPKPATFESWAARTPADFVFAVKASRYLTHIRRLKDPQEPVERLLDAARRLGPKLGPVLLQLPPDMERDLERLETALAAFPADLRVAVEFRHATWLDDETDAVLAAHGAARCLTDRDGQRTPVRRTADWGYVRFHSGCGSPRPCYGRDELEAWVEALAQAWPGDADRYLYFNNDPGGCALRDAAMVRDMCDRAGLAPTRTVDTGDVWVGDR